MIKHSRTLAVAASLAATFVSTLSARAEISGFYVGIDSRATLASGVYVGQLNPNFNRLTFLYPHAFPSTPGNNHYHGISTYVYVGPAGSPTIVNTNTGGWRIPEVYTGQAPLTLVSATNGLYLGKLISATTLEHYSTIRLRSVHTLTTNITAGPATNYYGYGSGEWFMFNSSGGLRTQSMAGAAIALELVSLTPGLHLGDAASTDIATNAGDRVTLGGGNNFIWNPVLWTETNAVPGTYDFKFKLVDMANSGPLESGVATIQFRVSSGPALTIAKYVHIQMPLATDGYALESAPAVTGPWTPVATAPEEDHIGSGESAQQTGTKTLQTPTGSGNEFYRLRKL